MKFGNDPMECTRNYILLNFLLHYLLFATYLSFYSVFPDLVGDLFFLVILRIFLIEGYSCLVFETGFPISKSKTIHAKNAHMSSAPANNKKVAGSFVKLSQFHQILIDMAVTKTKRATKCFLLKN